MDEKATLVILAGGKSTRMGYPKHLISTPDGTLIEHLYARLSPRFSETLVVGNDLPILRPQMHPIDDAYCVQSPLVGIYSGLVAAKTDLCFIVACDMPFVNQHLELHILSCAFGVDAVVPMVRGYYEPLCAAYRKSVVPVISRALAHNNLKVTTVYEYIRLQTIPESEIELIDPELDSFVNLNTPHQLHLLSEL